MYFFLDGHTIDFSTSITTCCIVASLQQFVVVSLCCVSLRHDDMKFIAASFFSLKPLTQSSEKKKAKEKRSHYSVIDWAKRIKRQLMENIIKCSYPKMTGQNDRPDESLTGQVHDQAGHCPLTGRYFEHWLLWDLRYQHPLDYVKENHTRCPCGVKTEGNAENLVLTSIYFIMIQLPILEAIDNHFGLN